MLKFDELMDEAQKDAEAHSLPFEAKGGTVVTLRSITHLDKNELKNVRVLLARLQDDDLDIDDKIDAMDSVLVIVADRKDAMRKSLNALPIMMRTRLFEEWQKAVQAPEA